MTDQPRFHDDLLGYLLGALDDDEARRIELALERSAPQNDLGRKYALLQQAVRPLDLDRQEFPAPPGLAERTLAFVAASSLSAPVDSGKRPGPRRRAAGGPRPSPVREFEGAEPSPRGRLDRLIIGATALAACVLVAPLLLDAVEESRARRAERNLQRLSAALQGYAESHGLYPSPPDRGPLSRAGLYAPTLVSEERLVADDGTVLCPDSELSRRGGFRIPSLAELNESVGTPRFEELVRTMGGDYGYTLGHRDADGVLQPNRNQRRARFPIMADAPDDCLEKSSNHPDGTHHVLFEDGHVRSLRPHAMHRDDHLYRNRHGEVGAGVDPHDAVIGDSHHQP